MQHPDCLVDLTNAGRPSKDRQVFDAKCSGNQEVAETMDPYKNLAVFYNSGPEQFPVKNLACEYTPEGVKTAVMASPYFSNGSQHTMLSFEGIFQRVKDLDPSDYIQRDAEWLKKQMGEIKKVLATLCGHDKTTGFYKSGNQDGENILTSWSQYNAYHGNPTWYDFLCITPMGPEFLQAHSDNGKLMGDVGKDTGEVGEDCKLAQDEIAKKRKNLEREKQRAKKKRQRENKKSRKRNNDKSSSLSSTPFSKSSSSLTDLTQDSSDNESVSSTESNLPNDDFVDLVKMMKTDYQNQNNQNNSDQISYQIQAAGLLANCNHPEDSQYGRDFLKSVLGFKKN